MATFDDDLPRDIALAWGVAAEPQRGPKREMSVERIVEAAVKLADEEGISAVSMAAVAARLGYTPMSLYRYVNAKDDLLLLMQEEATGRPQPTFEEGASWRMRLESLVAAQVQMYLRHPWMLDIAIKGSPATPNSSAWIDATLEALDGTPLSQQERLSVTLLVTGHSRWYGSVLAGYSRTARATGETAQEITDREAALYDRLITADEYPWLRVAVDAGVFRSEDDPFVFGLARILDGVESYIRKLEEGGSPDESVVEWAAADESVSDKRYLAALKAVSHAEKAVRDSQKTLRQARAAADDALKAAKN